MIEDIKKDAGERMQKSVDSLKLDLSKIRTGRAHAGILDHISVDYYGAQTLLTQLANITVADATTINIQPYEKTMIQAIEKSIRESDMGLNPATSGELIRIPMPALTEERRKEFIKILKTIGEKNKVAVRNIRREGNDELKKLIKDGDLRAVQLYLSYRRGKPKDTMDLNTTGEGIGIDFKELITAIKSND